MNVTLHTPSKKLSQKRILTSQNLSSFDTFNFELLFYSELIGTDLQPVQTAMQL